MPKAAKVTHPPKRPLNCESDPPLKTPLPPRGAAVHAPRIARVALSSKPTAAGCPIRVSLVSPSMNEYIILHTAADGKSATRRPASTIELCVGHATHRVSD
eukprot:1983033-Prymnesium_polylepis.1